MKDILHEQLSALADDELGAGEQTLLVKRLVTDKSLRQRLARYQVISDTLKGHLPDQVDPGFPARIRTALQDEAGPPAVAYPDRLFRPVAGLAIAASVAVVAILSLQSVRQTGTESVPAIASAPAPTDYIRAEGQPPVASIPGTVRNLDAYLVNHNEFAVNRGMQGMLPYVRIVGQGEGPGNREDAE
jgi:sigma-E factor negative regulatory protein RseA